MLKLSIYVCKLKSVCWSRAVGEVTLFLGLEGIVQLHFFPFFFANLVKFTVGALMDTHAGSHIPVGNCPPLGLDGMLISVIDFLWVPSPRPAPAVGQVVHRQTAVHTPITFVTWQQCLCPSLFIRQRGDFLCVPRNMSENDEGFKIEIPRSHINTCSLYF